MSSLKKDAYGSDLSRTMFFGFSRSPAGKYSGKFTIPGRRGEVRGNVTSEVNRGKKPWGIVIVEQEIQVDEEVKAEWAAEGIVGTPIGVTVSVEVPGTENVPTPEDMAQAFTIAREALAVKYQVGPEDIVIRD